MLDGMITRVVGGPIDNLPTSLRRSMSASYVTVVGSATDVLGLILLLGMGRDTGYSETYVAISRDQLIVPIVVDILTIVGGLTVVRLIARRQRAARGVALGIFGMNVGYRALSLLAFWVAASDTGTGQAAPDFSRSWVTCAGIVVFSALVVMVGGMATRQAYDYFDAPRFGNLRGRATRQVAIIVAVAIGSLALTAVALFVLVPPG